MTESEAEFKILTSEIAYRTDKAMGLLNKLISEMFVEAYPRITNLRPVNKREMQ